MKVNLGKKVPLVFGQPQDSFYKTLRGKDLFVSELRPGLEGMKSVASSCLQAGLKPIVICDNMIAYLMWRGLVSKVYLFAYASNKKEALCRTGSLIAALAAKTHKVPVVLNQAGPYKPQPSSLLLMDGKKVVKTAIKTHAPLCEEVPLKWIKRKSRGVT